MSGYFIRVWCRGCASDNDEHGCFCGGTELRGQDGAESEVPFATKEDAWAAGWKFVLGGVPYEFEVVPSAAKDEP